MVLLANEMKPVPGIAGVLSISIAALVLIATARPCSGQGYICAEGGGNEGRGEWAAAVFGWMLEKRPAARVVILGVRGRDEGMETVFRRHGAREVVQLAIADRAAASNADTAAVIASSDIVYMRGGDQSRYVFDWDETPVEAAIVGVFKKGGVVGGTSAGAAVLGEYIFDARNDTLLPLQALSDPWHPRLTLTHRFLSLTPGVLFDTHFTERGRIGRLPIMLARCRADFAADVLGVGLDYRTALCIGPDGIGEVRGEGTVTFVHFTEDSRDDIDDIATGVPPRLTNMRLLQLVAGDRFDLATWRWINPGAHARGERVEAGRESQAGRRPGQCRVSAADGCARELPAEDWRIEDAEHSDALYRGELRLIQANASDNKEIVMPRAWDDADRVENRVGGVMLALASGHVRRAYLLHCGVGLLRSPLGAAVVARESPAGAAVVLEAAAFSPVRGDSRSRRLPRADRLAGRLHILRAGDGLHADTGEAIAGLCLADVTYDGAIDVRDVAAYAEMAAAMERTPTVGQLQNGLPDSGEFVAALLDPECE